jgi:serralysin
MSRDILRGNGAQDTFVWRTTAETGVAGAEADLVEDFNGSELDFLVISPIDADATDPDNDTFTFIGRMTPGTFTAPGQIGYFTADTNGDGVDDQTYVLLNTDADAFQEATIQLWGVHTVDASWFVL